MTGGDQSRPRAELAGQVAGQPLGLGLTEQVGLVEQHHVGTVQLILEQLLDRALMLDARIGQPLGRDGGLVMGEAPLRQGGAVDHGDDAVDGDPGADLGQPRP